jgi:chromate transporter
MPSRCPGWPPGPGALLVTLIGWQVGGLLGAVAATVGIFGPAAVLIYGVAHLWRRHEGKRWQVALEAGLRPVAAGTILAAGWVLLQALEGGWPAKAIAVLATAALMLTRISPVVLLAAGAGLFIAVNAALQG